MTHSDTLVRLGELASDLHKAGYKETATAVRDAIEVIDKHPQAAYEMVTLNFRPHRDER